jgi:predicted nucleic acid-binding protein
MSPERLLLDTDIVIDLLKKKPARVDRFLALMDTQTQFLISPIVMAEVYAGAFAHEHKDIERFFRLCQVVAADGDIGRAAGLYANQYRKAFQRVSLEDYLLAATAGACRCPLWTGNGKHYPMDNITLFES